mgnify:FL=1
MNVLTRYIALEVLKAYFIAILILLTFYNLFTFADEMGDIGKGEYGLGQIVYYLALTTPAAFYALTPSAALLASLVALGSMANNHELVAMRSASLSIFAIIKAGMCAGLVVVLVSIVVSEFVVPEASVSAKTMRAEAQNKALMTKSENGFWLRDGKSYINVRKFKGEGHLGDLVVYELDEQRHLKVFSFIHEAIFIKENEWLTRGISAVQVGSEKVFSRQIEEKRWPFSITQRFLDIVLVKPETLSSVNLFHYIQFLKKNEQKTDALELAFWNRVTSPVVIMVMILIAVPFVVKVNRVTSIGFRILVGTVLGIGFHLFNKVVGYMGLVYGLDPLLMGVLPSLTILALASMVISSLR